MRAGARASACGSATGTWSAACRNARRCGRSSRNFHAGLSVWSALPRGDARMRSGRVALAAVFLGWIGGATAAPMMATMSGVSLTSHREVETVRWRHRHRGYGWGERAAGARDGSGESARTADDESLSRPAEVIRPDVGRRSYGSRSWRRDAARHEPGGLALNLDRSNRVAPAEVMRPDARRRRGWVDPPPP